MNIYNSIVMKNIIKRIVLWLEKGRIYFLTSLFLATLVGFLTSDVESALMVLLLLFGGAMLYEAFLHFGIGKDDDAQLFSVIVSVCLSFLVPFVLYFFWGGEFLNFSHDIMVKSMWWFFACSVIFYLIIIVWRCLLNWAKK